MTERGLLSAAAVSRLPKAWNRTSCPSSLLHRPAHPRLLFLMVDSSLSQGTLTIWVSLSLSAAVLGKPLPAARSFRDQLFFGRAKGSMRLKSFHFHVLQLLTRESKSDYVCTSSQERQQPKPRTVDRSTPHNHLSRRGGGQVGPRAETDNCLLTCPDIR